MERLKKRENTMLRRISQSGNVVNVQRNSNIIQSWLSIWKVTTTQLKRRMANTKPPTSSHMEPSVFHVTRIIETWTSLLNIISMSMKRTNCLAINAIKYLHQSILWRHMLRSNMIENVLSVWSLTAMKCLRERTSWHFIRWNTKGIQVQILNMFFQKAHFQGHLNSHGNVRPNWCPKSGK